MVEHRFRTAAPALFPRSFACCPASYSSSPPDRIRMSIDGLPLGSCSCLGLS